MSFAPKNSFVGVCRGGIMDGKFLEYWKSTYNVYRQVREEGKAAVTTKEGEYRFVAGQWIWHGLGP